MSNAYATQNAAWREKLIAVTARLSDRDLGRPADGPGWTVAGLLGHLAAAAIDAAIDALDPAFLAKVEADGKPVRLNRAAHREHHLEQIEKALA